MMLLFLISVVNALFLRYLIIVGVVPVSAFSIDRFKATCPADPTEIRQLDKSLVDIQPDKSNTDLQQDDDSIWVAVYRSNQNQPSVFVRDDFFHAMKEATTQSPDSADDEKASKSKPPVSPNSGKGFAKIPDVDSEKLITPKLALETPVAVAQLRRSPDFDDKWLLDSLRCGLKKEDTDESCDGGSEFAEALSVAVDTLIMHHLQQQTSTNENDSDNDIDIDTVGVAKTPTIFEGAIRSKATLFSNKLLEARGFEPVEDLSKDMATHVSTYDSCLEMYAERSTSTELASEARNRALQIVLMLGQLDREKQLEAKKQEEESKNNSQNDDDDDDDDGYDPWANLKMQI